MFLVPMEYSTNRLGLKVHSSDLIRFGQRTVIYWEFITVEQIIQKPIKTKNPKIFLEEIML